MSQLIAAPSPNHDERTLPISMLVLHYTGMETGAAALERLTESAAKVSAHYLVEEDGRVFQLVEDDRRAWHAGVSAWNGISNVNSASIGIEIVNGGHDYGLPAYPDVQINALIPLCKRLIRRFDIRPQNIVGHSDIAPDRKDDPGERFPWAGLAAAGIGLWPGEGNGDRRILFGPDDRDRGVALLQRGLAGIGYCIEIDGVMSPLSVNVVQAFQRRYRPDQIDGHVDMETFDLVGRLAQQL
ncbi:N-acetylmuramoyl-L-alanine amidase [Algimonas porphyrae]|uniref:N-acetylmuramoyl-L-alanine amidase n=1 Tax=Algimonas porphyrae TaxID=1128113 RepID=A0ABQ5UYB7_9PROT|nr:N-acetylmuramoyl-L-alanine amidase [Algimonas porphyrae]GLQ19842.1 N-acetyl-anhydromuranmyl-L-alanine amidase [Algimonas porphyrae]